MNPKKEMLVSGVIICAIFGIALYIRVAIPWNSVFQGDLVIFGGNDPWYNMRLVVSTLYNFPHRLWFDAYTYYPRGTDVIFPPLFDYLLAVITWLIGRGDPFSTLGLHGIETIGAIYPAVLGALTVIPVYFIGKLVANRYAGLFAAALAAILPGQYLQRSVLGFTDHHVLEILLTTIVMFLFLKALKLAKENQIAIETFEDQDWARVKAPLTYSLLMGFVLGAYYLTFQGSPLITAVIFGVVTALYLINTWHRQETDYAPLIIMPAFIVAWLMMLISPHQLGSEDIQIFSLLGAAGHFSTLVFLGQMLPENNKKVTLPLTLIVISVLAIVIMQIIHFSAFEQALAMVGGKAAVSLTIAEAHPMSILPNFFSSQAWQWFGGAIVISAFILPYLVYTIIKTEGGIEELYMIIWWSFMLLLCLIQNRFASYLAVPVAILAGYALWVIYNGITKYGNTTKAKNNKIKGKHLPSKSDEGSSQKTIAVIVILGLALLIIPPTITLTIASARGSGIDGNWYESLVWMRENTPDVPLDYYGLYESPGQGNQYPYPEGTYSIMSWWDYGHWITYIAHRIPVANPFQQGIGGPFKPLNEGAATFFTAHDEATANTIASKLGVRYVITDFLMADIFGHVYDKFGAITVWADDTGGYVQQVKDQNGNPSYTPSGKYLSTMVARLHIWDGTAVPVNSANTIYAPLAHYRLIHESPGSIGAIGGRDVRFVKIFEIVPGAIISGTVQPKENETTIVILTTNVTIGNSRTFDYTQIAETNNSYRFTVPYSTEEQVYDFTATPYMLVFCHAENGTLVEDSAQIVSVSEEAVMEGIEIKNGI